MNGEPRNIDGHYGGDVTVATVWLIFYVFVVGAILASPNAIELAAQ
jgi:hypothetical protein